MKQFVILIIIAIVCLNYIQCSINFDIIANNGIRNINNLNLYQLKEQIKVQINCVKTKNNSELNYLVQLYNTGENITSINKQIKLQ